MPESQTPNTKLLRKALHAGQISSHKRSAPIAATGHKTRSSLADSCPGPSSQRRQESARGSSFEFRVSKPRERRPESKLRERRSLPDRHTEQTPGKRQSVMN